VGHLFVSNDTCRIQSTCCHSISVRPTSICPWQTTGKSDHTLRHICCLPACLFILPHGTIPTPTGRDFLFGFMLRVFTKTCRSDSNLITIGWKKDQSTFMLFVFIMERGCVCISVSLSVANCPQNVTINLKKYNFA